MAQAKKPTPETSAAKRPAAKKPAVKKPAPSKPAAKKPATKMTATARMPPLSKPAPRPTPIRPAEGAATLLAEILASPSDVQARIVYGDLLSDAGDPRGTFIAHQAGLLATDPLDARYAPMLASSRRLEAAHSAEWIADVITRTGIEPGEEGRQRIDRTLNARWVGGFLDRIALEAEHIATEWPILRTREPIRGIELLVSELLDKDCRTLAAPHEFEVLKVSPSSWFTANSVADVLAWGMPKLRSLDLSGCDLGVSGAQLLANVTTDLADYFEDHVAPPPFSPGQLTELVLADNQLGDEGVRVLAGASHLDHLTTLDLQRCRIADPATLDQLRAFPRLERLSLAGNNALGAELGRLAGWEALRTLGTLALPQSTTPAAAKALFPEPSATLRTLALASAKDLGPSPVLLELATHLLDLDLGTTSIGDERWAALISADCTRHLLHLKANGCSLSDAAVTALIASPLARLISLDLSSNKLTDAALTELAAWPGLEHVTHLRLSNNRKITSTGLAALSASAHFEPAQLDLGKLADPPTLAALRERFGAHVVI